ncbi:MAG: AmmeMemoRadiSam system protein B [Candidatus Binataceae bacterium]
MDKPRIRPVEAFPVQYQNQTMVALRDPMGFAPQPIVIAGGAYFLLTLFDGNHSLLDIQEAYARRFGDVLMTEKLNELIEALDRAFFLDSPAFAVRVREVLDEFRASPDRAASHAGLCYENEPVKLRAELAAYFDPPNGPGRSPQGIDGHVPAGLIAPHIDPRRGGIAYAHAYAELMGREPPDLFVILGTSHYGGGPQLFSATRKNYRTPLGTIETDRDFIGRLEARYSGDLFADELLHRNEHSIEFQALFLAWALGTLGFKVVPILVSSFHEMVRDGVTPANHESVRSFIDAMRAELAADGRRACIISGVDFAHVGKKFGDEKGVDDGFIDWLKAEDLALIEHIKRGDPAGFFADILKDKDRRRICGLSPMYTQLELLSGRQGRLLKYDVALEPQTESAVSFASLALD